MFGGGNMQGMLKKVQKMQKDMEKAQEEIKNTVVEASIGGGAVSVTMNGEQEVLAIKIAPAAVDPEDVEALEDLILAAVNEANRKAKEVAEKKLGAVTGNLKLPGMPGMFYDKSFRTISRRVASPTRGGG